MGMMSKAYSFVENGYKKNKNNIVLFYPFTNYSSFTENNIYIHYLLQEEYDKLVEQKIPHKKSKGKQLLSKIDEEFIKLPGDKYHEFRETRNKYNKIVEIKNEPNSIEEIDALIDIWDKNRGAKYGWQRHSGYDRNFFHKFFQQEKDNLFSYFFYIDNKLVGYSIVSKLSNNGINFNYVIRKNDTSYRNLCLYIDLKTFTLMFEELKQSFIVNWGSSDKGILKYKKKFPVLQEDVVYFCKVVKNKPAPI